MLTTEAANKAWTGIINSILRKPTDSDLAALMPVDHPMPVDKMTVGELLDFQENLWKAKQVRDIIGLLMKETAFARRNEHHQIAQIFGKEVYEALPDVTKQAIKARFDELNGAIKGNF